MTVYDINNEDALKSQGYKIYKDSTLKSMSKNDLIEQIRILEHNWAGEIKANWLQSYRLQFTNEIFEEVIKEIKNYNPKYCELDYTYDDEPYLNYMSLDIDYIVHNILETHKIDEPTREEQLFGNIGFFMRFLNNNEFVYFTDEENKAVSKYIEDHSIEKKDNFYDYYNEGDCSGTNRR